MVFRGCNLSLAFDAPFVPKKSTTLQTMQVVTGFRHPFAVDPDGGLSLGSRLYKTATRLQAGSSTALEVAGLAN